jgi:lysophospholipase L1-like esterase
MSLRLALAAGSVLVALLGLELGLRLVWKGYYLKVDQPYAKPHPTRGWCNRPDLVVADGESEFRVTATHDRDGHRVVPAEGRSAQDRVRVLVLGDSFSYGVGVEDDQTYCARLAALAPGLEVINAGVNGYGTGQQLLALREEGPALQPAIVVVGFFWNDLEDNAAGPTRASLVLVDGVLRELPAPDVSGSKAPMNRPPRRAWLRHSYAYRFLSDRLKLLREGHGAAHDGEPGRADALTGDEREAAWQLTFALLREFPRTARAGGARLVLLVIPDQVQVQTEVRFRGFDETDWGVLDRLRPFAEQEGIPLVDPLPALQAELAARRAPLYYREDRHLRPEGHAVVARALYLALRELCWIDAEAAGEATSGRPAEGR